MALARLYDAEGRHEEAAKYLAIFKAPPPAGSVSTHRPP
jgi:hypothetical protein